MALKGALNFTQIKALLWKDVLVRARQPVSETIEKTAAL